MPPHSTEAEIGVLGCILYGHAPGVSKTPQDCISECLERIKPGDGSFYDLRHQILFDLLVEMFDAKQPIDLITVHQKLRDKQSLEQLGGIGYLTTLCDAVPSPSNLENYLGIVVDKANLRRLLRTCSDLSSWAYACTSADELIERAEREIRGLGNIGGKGEIVGIKELVRQSISTIEDFHQRKGALTGLGTGFPDFDKLTSGLHAGEMIVIAARPSVGKTSLAMNIAEHVAIEQKLPVGVFSLEMTAESIVMRMLCSRARVNIRKVRNGYLEERDFPKLSTASAKLSISPLYIDDASGLSVLQLRAKARRMHQRHGIKLFIVDYLQLLHSTSKRADNRQQEISDISGGIKALAKELSVPVIVLSQLNRELEKDKNRKPRLSDLRESGSIEQDADLVGLLYRPARDDNKADENPDAEPINLLIAKQRSGPANEDVNLTFLKSFTRFESCSRISADDAP